MLIELTTLSICLLWILLVSLLARIVLPDRFGSHPKLGIVLWFASLLSSLLAGTIALIALFDAYLISATAISTAEPGDAQWWLGFAFSFLPWLALAVFGVILALINFRLDSPVRKGKRIRHDLELALRPYRVFQGVQVRIVPVPISYALATKKEILISQKSLDVLTPDELEIVLWHELGHLRAKHHTLKSLARLVAILTRPINLSLIFSQEIDRLCELEADRFAAQRTSKPRVSTVRTSFLNAGCA